LCRFLVGRLLLLLDLLLRSALRAEVDLFLGKLLATVRTESSGFLEEFRATPWAEVSIFVGELRAALRAR
jgi:hypothetical protein